MSDIQPCPMQDAYRKGDVGLLNFSFNVKGNPRLVSEWIDINQLASGLSHAMQSIVRAVAAELIEADVGKDISFNVCTPLVFAG